MSLQTTTDPPPVWTTWPDAVITPVTDNVDRPKPSDGGYVTPCKLWFFWVSPMRGKMELLAQLYILPIFLPMFPCILLDGPRLTKSLVLRLE